MSIQTPLLTAYRVPFWEALDKAYDLSGWDYGPRLCEVPFSVTGLFRRRHLVLTYQNTPNEDVEAVVIEKERLFGRKPKPVCIVHKTDPNKDLKPEKMPKWLAMIEAQSLF